MQQLEPRIMLDAVVDWTHDPLHHNYFAADAHTSGGSQSVNFHQPFTDHFSADSSPYQKASAQALDVIVMSHSVMSTPGVSDALSKDAFIIGYDDQHDSAQNIIEKLSDLADTEGRKIGTLAVLQHGRGGAITLGSDTIHLADVGQKVQELQSLATLFTPGGQIQFYACSSAGYAQGQALLDVLSAITGLDVFASVNDTGRGNGKDWYLEYSTNPYSTQKTLIDAEAMAAAPLELAYKDTIITAPSTQNVTVNTPTVIYDAVNDNSILVRDDANPNVTMALMVDHGVLTVQVPSTPPGETPVSYTSSVVSFTATVTDINSALAGMIYTPEAKYEGGDTLTVIAIESGISPPDWDMEQVTLNFHNDPPVISATTSVDIAGSGSHLIDDISVSDGDIGTTNMTVGLSVLSGTLSVPTSTTVTGNGTSVMSITDTLTNINTLLSQLRYTPTTGYTGTDTLHITADDLSTPTPGTDSKDVTLLIGLSGTPFVSAPDIQTVNEDATLRINPPISVNYSNPSSELKISLEVQHGTVLAGWKGLLSSYIGEGTSKLEMTGLLSPINYALNGVRYVPDHDYFGADQLKITFDPQDGNASLSKTININVNSVNDPPALTVTSGYSAASGSPTSIQGITVSDPDVGSNRMSLNMRVLHGTVSTSAHAASSSIAFTDTLNNVNTQLGSLIYTSIPSYRGPDYLTITISDNGNSGAGGVLIDTRTYTINVS